MKQPPRPNRTDAQPLRRARPAARQRGSIAVLAAVFISVAVILLASIDIGYLFFQKRELQKVADLAALASAQQLARSNLLPNDRCASAYLVADNNARAGQGFTGATVVSCGKWDPATVPTAPYYSAYAGGVTPAGQSAPNAISVQVTQTFGSFFGAWTGQQVTASAIAVGDAPTAVFSVGSRLLQINGGVVPGLLTALGININGTSLLSYNGLANVSVTPSGLLSALGFQIPLTVDVGTIKQILQVNTGGCSGGSCTLQSVLGALSVAGGQQNLASALGLDATQLSLQVKLISDAAGRGLFTVADTADGQAALQANVNALDLLTASLGVANSHHFVDSGLTLPGVVKLQVGIIEPPSIGIGGIGATAYTSQIRLYGSLLLLLTLQIDAVDGQATITDICTSKDGSGNDTATLAVASSLVTLCLGSLNANGAFSTTSSCQGSGPVNATPITLIKGESRTVPGSNQIIGVGSLIQGLLSGLISPLTTLLANLLGIQLGEVDVKLIDLNCGGGPHVRLVH